MQSSNINSHQIPPAKVQIEISIKWLQENVFPIWKTKGFDFNQNAFSENLSRNGDPLPDARRGLVQARQIYSFAEAKRMGILLNREAEVILSGVVESYVKIYSCQTGAFYYSADIQGNILDKKIDLYSQAFALFGLAHAFDILRNLELKLRAKKLCSYLMQERRAKFGGFTELAEGKIEYLSNPHMHLFEAAISWCAVDSDPVWKTLADEIFELCKSKFVDSATGALAEQFSENWEPLRTANQFVLEPGHQFEWAWLLLEYQRICGVNVGSLPLNLFKIGENWGVDKNTNFVLDEIWSDEKPKKTTSRCWPQCERIKAAVSLQKFESADQALSTLLKYFNGMKPGLWEDLYVGDGKFLEQPVKASSLYHIINALSEYSKKRNPK